MVTKHQDAGGTYDPLLTPAETAARFNVHVMTIVRWAKAGKLTERRTLGGHRRFLEAEVNALLGGNGNGS